MFQLMTHGWHQADLAAAMIRFTIGLFFAISGYHKLFNPARKAKIAQVMINDHVPFPGFMKYWVPGWEFAGGILLMLGLFSAFAASVLMIICLVACCCEAREKVASYKPIDMADVVDDYLYLPEVLYIILLASVVITGTGRFSLDHMLWT